MEKFEGWRGILTRILFCLYGKHKRNLTPLRWVQAKRVSGLYHNRKLKNKGSLNE